MPFYWPELLIMAAFHDRGKYKSRIFLLSSGYFTLSLSVAFHEVSASPSAVDLNEIKALALFYRPKLSIMAAEEISKPSDRGGLRRAKKYCICDTKCPFTSGNRTLYRPQIRGGLADLTVVLWLLKFVRGLIKIALW